MAKTPMISTKRVAISRANAQMVGIVAGAAFISIFCLVAAHAAWSTNRYQAKVTGVKEKAHKQLQQNISNFSSLQTSYKAFDATSTNAIGGNSTGSGENDGKNSKIILDALPPSYDFPALASSIEKILSDNGLKITNITGTDDQVNQQSNTSSPTPKPVEMPFSFTVSNATYQQAQDLIVKLQKSIRPIQIDSLIVSGGATNMTLTVNAHTYYQPGKNLNITKQVVK